MLYKYNNSKAKAAGVMTNTIGYGAMNGFWCPEAMYSVEKLIDKLLKN
jgi:xanthine dehydrogenase molybdopterin-binding subunit B